jgi:hypothetical protein
VVGVGANLRSTSSFWFCFCLGVGDGDPRIGLAAGGLAVVGPGVGTGGVKNGEGVVGRRSGIRIEGGEGLWILGRTGKGWDAVVGPRGTFGEGGMRG